MRHAPTVGNEANRLAALHEYGIKNTLADPDLDNLVNLAANVFNVPIVLVSLLESERQLLAAGVGVSFSETPIDIAFCLHTVLKKRILVVPDTHKDRTSAIIRWSPALPIFDFMPASRYGRNPVMPSGRCASLISILARLLAAGINTICGIWLRWLWINWRCAG